jgi:hypothetical protein
MLILCPYSEDRRMVLRSDIHYQQPVPQQISPERRRREHFAPFKCSLHGKKPDSKRSVLLSLLRLRLSMYINRPYALLHMSIRAKLRVAGIP